MKKLLYLLALLNLTIPAAFAQCPQTLAYLDAKLPSYNHPSLRQARAAVLNENVEADYQKMIASGLSPAQAASEAIKSSQSAEAQRMTAQQCIRQVSTDPDAIIKQLEDGTYNFTRDTIMESCAASYVLMYYMAVGMKEMALTVACRARN